jgi:ribosomal protein S18 acetylase RimI-like enzyme
VARLLGELGYPTGTDQAGERLERLMRDPTSQLWIAEVDGEVAGLAALHVMNLVEHEEPGCVMSALVVGERFRRRGIGERLAEAVEEEARSRGCTRVVLSSAHRRADAHAFYEQLGYEHTGRRYAKDL